MNVSPETMREQYLQDALINEPTWGNPEGSGRLKEVVERLMQSRSLASLAEATPLYTPEARRTYGHEGEFFKDDAGITAEQYGVNQDFAALIPDLQDFIKTGGTLGNGLSYTPTVGPSLINSRFATVMKDIAKRANTQNIYLDNNPNDPNGLYPLDEPMPYDDYSLSEYDEPDTSIDGGGTMIQSVQFPGRARALQPLAQIIKRTAEQVNLRSLLSLLLLVK